jgi:nucleoside-diphosphate-sugar epimerase
MTRLIIGCGYLGRRVAARWLAQGERVVGTTRTPSRADELARLGVEPLLCDVLDRASLKALPEAEAVVHCVGYDRQSGAPIRKVCVDGLANVLAALPAAPPLVYVSSTSVYAQADGADVDEGAATEPADEPGRVALEAEAVVRRHRPGAVVLRLAGLYGPGRLIRAADLKVGRLLAIDPEKWLNLVHVEDGAAAVVAAVERGEPGEVYNVSDGCPVRRRDFYTRLAELLGAPPPRFVPPPEPVPASERVNRRIVSRKMRERLGVTPAYPDYEQGLAASG